MMTGRVVRHYKEEYKMKVVPYLNFAHSKEVLAFYEKLGAKTTELFLADDAMFADMPDDVRPENPSEFVMNAGFEVLGNLIYLSDTMGNTEVDHSGSNLCFTFDQHDESEVQKVKDFFQNAIDQGCEVEMPLEPSEWSELFGMFRDPYGVSWMFSGE